MGEKVQIFSGSAGGWVPGKVTELVDGDARVRYFVGGEEREKLVAAVSTELKRKLTSADLDLKMAGGQKTGKGKEYPDSNAMARAKAALMRVASARTKDSIRELVAWTYFVDLFHGLTLGERQQLCMEAEGERFGAHEPLVRAGQTTGAISRRRDCHFSGTPCLSLLIQLLKVQGGAIK